MSHGKLVFKTWNLGLQYSASHKIYEPLDKVHMC